MTTTSITAKHKKDNVYGYVGSRLKELRLEAGLRQSEVAAIIGVSPQQYQKYEDAQTKCRLDYLLALADHYSVSADTFLPGFGVNHSSGKEDAELASEADLLARLVSAFVQLNSGEARLRLVQLVEAIVAKKSET